MVPSKGIVKFFLIPQNILCFSIKKRKTAVTKYCNYKFIKKIIIVGKTKTLYCYMNINNIHLEHFIKKKKYEGGDPPIYPHKNATDEFVCHSQVIN